MRPENLKSPFSWENRQIRIQDKVWFIPDYYENYADFQFPGWDHQEIFGNSNPVFIEYCSGNGSWIAAKALQNPQLNWVAVELKFARVRKIWSKIKNLKLNNLFVICGEGLLTTRHYLANESIEGVFVNFPDPWPKKRHAKHRIIKPEFVKEMSRILKKQGNMTLVTDDETYSKEMIEVCLAEANFFSQYPDPYFVHELPGYGTSYFEDLWREKGKNIFYHQFLKR